MKTVLEWKRCSDEQPKESGDYFAFVRVPSGGMYFTTIYFHADKGAGWNCYKDGDTEMNMNDVVYMWADQPNITDFYSQSEEGKNG